MTAVGLHQAGRLDEAEEHYRKALALDPDDFDALHLLGLLAYQKGDARSSAELISRALRQRPSDPFAHNNLGNALDALGKPDDALEAYRTALRLKHDYPEACNNLGATLKNKGMLDQAVEQFEKAVVLQPDYVDAHFNLGAARQTQGRFDDAGACYRKVLTLQPAHAATHYRLGLVLALQKKHEEAVVHYRRSLELKPDDSETAFQLAYSLNQQGKQQEAVAWYEKAISLRPDFATAHYNLGRILYQQGRLRDALACYQNALAHKPDLAEAYYNLGITLHELHELDLAARCYSQAIALRPDYVEAHNNLGQTLKWKGQLEGSIASYRNALALNDSFEVASNLLGTILYSNAYSAEQIHAEFLQCAERFEAPLKPLWRPHTNTPDPDKRLKIGYVSADFRRHSVAFFIELILSLHDRSKFEIFCYYNLSKRDDVTSRFMAIADHWLDCEAMSDDELAERIRSDGIDVLVDLSGHTAHNRLLTFARKPAPVQATWIGLPATTGLTAMDYRMTDEFLDPTGVADKYSTEKLVRLPFCAPYQPPENCPAVNDLPALRTGKFTFACLNNPAKLSDDTINLWAKILLELPEARLVLGNMDSNETRLRLLDMFAQHGITADRFIMQQKMGLLTYMRLHHEIDAALDPFPFNGGTTTTHALWMGVPVVALEGSSGVSRVGSSIMKRIGLPQLVAGDTEEYLRIAVGMARDLPALNSLRQSLRERFRLHMQPDPAVVTRHVEDAFRQMWRTWCKEHGQPGRSASNG